MRKGFLWASAISVVLGGGAYFGFLMVRSPHLLPGADHCLVSLNDAGFMLDPDQAGNAATIAALSVKRDLKARAATIGIATALQESKLRNINYGDRDSLGLFQQRPSQGWGTEAEILDPVYSTNAFYSALEKIPDYSHAEITVVAQEVQRSAFPDAYAKHEPMARLFASALTGHTPRTFTCTVAASSVAMPDPQQAAKTITQSLTAQFGIRDITIERSGTGSDSTTSLLVSLPAQPDPQGGADSLPWAVAAWATAHVHKFPISSVETQGYAWNRDDAAWAKNAKVPTSKGTVQVKIRLDA